jgi:hypothetical protein
MSIIVPPGLTRLTRVDGRSMQRAAVRAVQASMPGRKLPPKFSSLVAQNIATVSAGFTASTSGLLAMGAEFGGRRRPPVTYLRKGRAVRRRTTMQFLPFNPRGYALTPATRASMEGIRQRIVDAVMGAATDA